MVKISSTELPAFLTCEHPSLASQKLHSISRFRFASQLIKLDGHRHAGRTVVTKEDAMMLARKNEGLEQLLRGHLDS